MLWALWTGKEAAYKALQKDDVDIPSIPRLYKVQFENTGARECSLPSGKRLLCGSVSTPAGNIRLETLIASDYVHSIAASLNSLPDRSIIWKAEHLPGNELSPADESSYVRGAAIRHLAQYLPGSNLQDIEIIRRPGRRGLGPPAVFVRKKPAAIDISLSHDGGYAAYAFALASYSYLKLDSNLMPALRCR